ncbi:MAG TPA: hypothetical protein VGO50_13730 [Pyrinomonadaceae bacterium]|jgi:hypothetical protein|nr:hypothetical protein [Pyrinomonadaceae bacterium]
MKRCLPSFVAFCLLVEMLVISPPVFSQTAKQTKPSLLVETSEGLTMARIVTPQGIVQINFPDDMAAGDTISGTVSVEPKGSTEEEKAANAGVLKDYALDLGDGNKVKADKPTFTWEMAAKKRTSKPAAKKPRYVSMGVKVLAPGGGSAGEADIQLWETAPPTPSNINIPGIAQSGHNIPIPGPFGNAAGPANTAIGGQTAPLLAASPRKIIVKVPNGITPGPNPINVNSGSTQASGTIRVVSVGLSAPKLNLQKGEKTTLTAQINGLQGITAPVPLQIVTTGTVSMQGGNKQDFQIQPGQVQPSGSYSQTFELTGIQPGGFRVDVTVITSDPGPVAAIPSPTPTPSPVPSPVSSPAAESGPPIPPRPPLPGECGCWCQFDDPNIVLNSADKNGVHTFEPIVTTSCGAIDDTVCTSSLSYEWKVGSATTAAYSIQAGTDKTKNLSLKITRSGKLELSLTVKVKCSNGTKDFDCQSNATEMFDVTAPKLDQALKYPPTNGIPHSNLASCSCKSEFAAPNITSVNQVKILRPGEFGQYSFEPKVNVSCSGDLCQVKGVSYAWFVHQVGTTALFTVKDGVHTAKRLTIKVTKAGTIKLSVTVTVNCTDNGPPCSSTGTRTFNVAPGNEVLRLPKSANVQISTTCKTTCDFATPNIVLTRRTFFPDGMTQYEFEAQVTPGCGENCEPPEVTYQWTVDPAAPGSAEFYLQGSLTSKTLVIKVRRDGRMYLSVTATAKCGFGTTPCTSTGTGIFEVNRTLACTCDGAFNANQPIVLATDGNNPGRYEFTADVKIGCVGGGNLACQYPLIPAQDWSISSASTAQYTIVPGTNTSDRFVVIIRTAGTLVVNLTVTTSCTELRDCQRTVTRSFSVSP